MDVNIVIALMAGMLFGWIVDYALVRAGLTRWEWKALKQIYRMLQKGQYKISEVDDGAVDRRGGAD